MIQYFNIPKDESHSIKIFDNQEPPIKFKLKNEMRNRLEICLKKVNPKGKNKRADKFKNQYVVFLMFGIHIGVVSSHEDYSYVHQPQSWI